MLNADMSEMNKKRTTLNACFIYDFGDGRWCDTDNHIERESDKQTNTHQWDNDNK